VGSVDALEVRRGLREWPWASQEHIADVELERRLLGHQFAKEPKAKLMDQQSVARTPVQKPPLDPDVADTAPSDPVLTAYDEEHLITYLRLLDADMGHDMQSRPRDNRTSPGLTKSSLR
jgi:hypothetical protein